MDNQQTEEIMKARRWLRPQMGSWMLGLAMLVAAAHGAPAAEGLREGQATVAADVAFTPEQMKSRFIGDFTRWAKADQGTLPQPDAVLAIGSSSMRMWKTIAQDLAPAKIIHRGFGGSTMRDVVTMQDFFGRYGCRKILIYQGDNDLVGQGKQAERDFIAPLTSFIAGIRERHPETEFYLLSVKFSPSRMPAKASYAQANEAMRTMADGDDRIHFIDVNTPMLDDQGNPREELFLADRLHMNGQGYAIWTKAVRQALLGE